MKKRTFNIGDILGVYAAVSYPPNYMNGDVFVVYFMTGVDFFDYAYHDARFKCIAELERQLPWLKEVVVLENYDDPKAVKEWYNKQVEMYGELHEIVPFENYNPVDQVGEEV